MVVELSVDEEIRLHHVWCATDAGLVINPDGVINQLEGGIIQSASWVLKEQVRFDNGVASFDWETYPVLKFSEVPEIDIELINTKDEVPLGVGEVTAGPTAAAIGNAVSHALGARIRDLPLTRERIMATLLRIARADCRRHPKPFVNGTPLALAMTGIGLQARPRPGAAMVRIDFNRLRFLVIDDNAHMRRILRTLLHGFGAREVYEAEDGAAGLEAFTHYLPDIVITDWAMPIFDGLELMQMIRQPGANANPYVAIIMLTGHSEKKRVMAARDAGVTEFLAKPISAKGLYQRIVNVVANPRPFIKTKTYFGPDRRRNINPNYIGPSAARAARPTSSGKPPCSKKSAPAV